MEEQENLSTCDFLLSEPRNIPLEHNATHQNGLNMTVTILEISKNLEKRQEQANSSESPFLHMSDWPRASKAR